MARGWRPLLLGPVLGLIALTGCGITVAHSTHTASVRRASHPLSQMAHLVWYPVNVGSTTLVQDGSQISSVLAGPYGRIYYGTEDPFGNATTIGWINPTTTAHNTLTVPHLSNPFPKDANVGNLDQESDASWGSIDLVVSGSKNMWFREWGYVAGWSASTNQLVSGDYAVPGPTAHTGDWTASINSTFSGTSQLQVMNTQTHAEHNHSVPGGVIPQSILLKVSRTHQPKVWILSGNTIWYLSPLGNGTWSPIVSVASGDFFVAMGEWGNTIWTLDANGHIATITAAGLTPVTTINLSPLDAVTAPGGGLWISSVNHISLWEPKHALITWVEPKNDYPAPASTWATSGSSEPPDWPPIGHIAAGAHDTVDIGEGTWIGVASLNSLPTSLDRRSHSDDK